MERGGEVDEGGGEGGGGSEAVVCEGVWEGQTGD